MFIHMNNEKVSESVLFFYDNYILQVHVYVMLQLVNGEKKTFSATSFLVP